MRKPEDVDALIDAMCMTWRHDFGLPKGDTDWVPVGMTEQQRDGLRLQMRQLYEHHLKPAIMAAKAEEREACALLIEQGYDRQGITTKNDKCPHGLYGWEDCEQCAVRAIRSRKEVSP